MGEAACAFRPAGRSPRNSLVPALDLFHRKAQPRLVRRGGYAETLGKCPRGSVGSSRQLVLLR